MLVFRARGLSRAPGLARRGAEGLPPVAFIERQRRYRRGDGTVFLFAFDLLELNGQGSAFKAFESLYGCAWKLHADSIEVIHSCQPPIGVVQRNHRRADARGCDGGVCKSWRR